MHPRVIANALGVVLAAVGATMIVPTAYALLYGDGNFLPFLLPMLAGVTGGAALFYSTRSSEQSYVSIRDVFLIVVSGWFLVGTLGAVPFVVSGALGPVNAFFDSMAGFTTTGASTISTPEGLDPSLLLWRSMSQWAGGIGIIVLFVAIAPIVGFGATQLYAAEMPNPTQERLTPRIQDTAKVLTYIYLSLTAGIALALLLAGMGAFDAVNHALTTVSTGGYSTRSDSVAAFDSAAIEYVIVFGMIFSGTNFGFYFLAIQGRLRRALRSPELLAYLGIISVATLLLTLSLFRDGAAGSLSESFRAALFQSASLSTGTAFTTESWDAWDPFAQSILMLLMAIGGCAGSTSGGIKVVRAVVLTKNALQDALRLLHPRAVTPLKLGERIIPERLRQGVLGFVFIYLATLALGTVIIAAHGVAVGDAFGSVFACINITGTSLGSAGDPAFYASLPPSAKLVLTFCMLMGRLELLTVLVVLTPAFWRR
ncbi:Trk-type K+ transport systems membrane component [Rubrobacter radiotolerans]|uniref:Trk-type K+ transport systems membrane component n=1 Tax=Rubrobacter radiotolerans TaxID=42256 RepID=A0A023X2V4_RUBRA|nr:TrkH family potassium uptake protein [Rubrobacter radiotolerans]AHY46531.1 Trk-type K+ transport systems membrane component [Rubrobacter radiotolerans]MDX5893939.1 TrkH family potassium uptake protein [Rubrobacter radiotolerans]SMC04808.1 trk system potassium uptake protein TrkH [Rubrobacter radiotolerans DSM 5868]